jgi:MFS family permease
MTATPASDLDMAPPTPEPAAKPPSLWRNRSFTLLWGSQLLSDLGANMSMLAFPLLVLALTGSAVTAGWVGTGSAITRLIVRLPAGVLVDRVNRKRTMIICDAARLVAYTGLGVLILTGHTSLVAIVVTAVVDAIGSTIFGTAETSALRNVVPMASLPIAVARNEARMASSALVGPPLGGLLYSVSRAVPFLGDAASYLLSLIGISLIRVPLQEERTKPAGTPLTELKEGLRHCVNEPFVRAAMIIAPPLNLAFSGIMFAAVIILRKHGVAPALIGTVDTIIAVGGLLGAICAGTMMKWFKVRTLIMGICWFAVVLFASAALFTSSILIAVPIALAIFLSPACNSALFGYLAAITPDELQGRVMSVIFTAAQSLAVFAPLLAGVFYDWLGPVGTVLAFAGAVAIAALVATTSKGIRQMRNLATDAAETPDLHAA